MNKLSILLVILIAIGLTYLSLPNSSPKQAQIVKNKPKKQEKINRKKSPKLEIETEEIDEFEEELRSIESEKSTTDRELEKIQSELTNIGTPVFSEPTERKQISKDSDSKSDYLEFSDRDLRDLNKQSNNQNPIDGNGLIGGVNRSTGSVGAGVVQQISEDDPNAVENSGELESLSRGLTGQSKRGYNMIYLMHPNARNTVEAQMEALKVSGLQEYYLGVLTDGTFGKDFSYLSSVVRRLNQFGKSVTLVLYLTNGSTMRRFDSTSINAGFNRIDPERFRSLIRFDPATRAQFLLMVSEVKPVFELNKSLGEENQNIAIVMLEDNLNRDSYIAMRDLAKQELGDLVTYMRNPCPGCYDGNDQATDGDPVERHNPFTIPALGSRDGFSNDGTTYFFPWEEEPENSVSTIDLKNLAVTAKNRNLRFFGLWRRERQGLNTNVPNSHPNQRSYEVPTVDQLVEEVQILRSGLN